MADDGFVSFEVDESNNRWVEFQDWIARRRPVDIADTKFSRKEVAEATWLEMVPDWHHGYPQPDEAALGYRLVTYDLRSWCELCGVGMEQVAPFRMKGEPRWGKRSILQLNWIFDEYFVTPDAWALVFKPHGIDVRPVMSTLGTELRSVVQLIIPGEVGVATQELSTEEPACPRCGRTKYLPVARGCFPTLRAKPETAMVKTREYFGSGALAHKRVLVSQVVAHSFISAKLRGASFRPVADAGTACGGNIPRPGGR